MTKTFVAFDLPKVSIPLTTLTEQNVMKNGTDIDAAKYNR